MSSAAPPRVMSTPAVSPPPAPASPPPAPAVSPPPPPPPAAVVAPHAATPPPAPENTDWWGNQWFGGDGGVQDASDIQLARRFTDPVAMLKALKDSRAALSDGGRVKVPGEGATDDEVAAFHKAFGVPEKPEGYEPAAPPEGFALADIDKQFLDRMRTRAKAMGMSQKQFRDFTGMFYEEAAGAQDARESAYADSAVKADKALRDRFGSNYDREVGYANAAVKHYFEGDAGDLIDAKITTRDGFVGNLGDWPPFVAMMTQIGHQTNEDPFFQQAVGSSSGDPPEKELEKLMLLKKTDSAKYAEQATQDRIDTLIEAINRKKGITDDAN